jgi:hypothetical protein
LLKQLDVWQEKRPLSHIDVAPYSLFLRV